MLSSPPVTRNEPSLHRAEGAITKQRVRLAVRPCNNARCNEHKDTWQTACNPTRPTGHARQVALRWMRPTHGARPVGRCTGNGARAHGRRSLEWQRAQPDRRPPQDEAPSRKAKRDAKCRPKDSDRAAGCEWNGAAPADREILDLFPVPCECLHALPRAPIPHTNLHAPIRIDPFQTRARWLYFPQTSFGFHDLQP